jgi:hypothetical protein
LLKTIETKAGNGMLGMNYRACKAGALPAELHAHGAIHIKYYPSIGYEDQLGVLGRSATSFSPNCSPSTRDASRS